MITQLTVGGIIIAVTVLFQAISFDLIIRKARWMERFLKNAHTFRKAFLLTIIVLTVCCVLIVEIWVWALFYLAVDALPDLETALYFSTSAFTTVGYGDVVLGQDWRMLSSIEATSGFLLFGWSAAFIFEIVSKVYLREGEELSDN